MNCKRPFMAGSSWVRSRMPFYWWSIRLLTIGKSGKLDNVLASRETLETLGISLFFIERGGDVTYHGPGQIVGYPIIDLRHRGKDIRKFVYDLEEVLLRTLKDFSVEGERDSTHPGCGSIMKKWRL